MAILKDLGRILNLNAAVKKLSDSSIATVQGIAVFEPKQKSSIPKEMKLFDPQNVNLYWKPDGIYSTIPKRD